MEADEGAGFAPQKSLARTPPQGLSTFVGGAEAEVEAEAEVVRGLRAIWHSERWAIQEATLLSFGGGECCPKAENWQG